LFLDDAFSSVPYEKGYNLLHYLETIVGGPKVMNVYLKAHCERYQYSTTDTEEWKVFFLSYFKGKVEEEKLNSIDWDAW
jgi:leukotriene-A4 hydrolase